MCDPKEPHFKDHGHYSDNISHWIDNNGKGITNFIIEIEKTLNKLYPTSHLWSMCDLNWELKKEIDECL